MKILNVVGARPNFMKIAPLVRSLQERGIEQRLLHTGQHYDDNMSKVFFEDLRLAAPDIYLGVGSGTHAEQTARIMVEFEKVCAQGKPDLVVVVGDVNSTLACSVACAKLRIPVAHVEAGPRSFDRRMPEEVNRVVTDQLAEILLTPSPDGDANLFREGVPAEKIHRVHFLGGAKHEISGQAGHVTVLLFFLPSDAILATQVERWNRFVQRTDGERVLTYALGASVVPETDLPSIEAVGFSFPAGNYLYEEAIAPYRIRTFPRAIVLDEEPPIVKGDQVR